MDFGVWPARFNCACGSSATVDHSDQRCFDALEQALVVVCGFLFAPVPGDDVVERCRHDQTATCGVGAVDEDLVVDPACMADGRVRHVNQPKGIEFALQRTCRAAHVAGDRRKTGPGGQVLDERTK